jgi:parvulin-like peptidyl-prolyl isomerase
MKRWILLAASAAVLCGQAPIPNDTVVATVDGKSVTAGELREIIASAPPSFLAVFKSKPDEALRDYFVVRALAEEGEKLKLGEQSPWKEQIESARREILTNATISHELNAYVVPEPDVQSYFEANKGKYQQVTVKLIKIGFNPNFKPTDTSNESLEKAAQATIAAAHSPSRSEADAKKLADDLAHQARGGVDFAKLATQYSDDEETKKSGGDFGVITMNTSYVPVDLRRAALALEPGQVSDPIKVSGIVYYIVKCEKKSALSLQDVHSSILLELRQQHTNQLLKKLQQQYLPAILKPEALIQIGNGK